MDLTCYLHPGWAPLIRPAEATRPWMDATPDAFAYRCLPLNIANASGWEILSPCAFEASWNGRSETRDVIIRLASGTTEVGAPVSLFGQGVLSFHIPGLFRTPPGWDLWVGGSPNRPKEGIYPLTGVIETDWAPYTFTMNWRFTRRHHRVRFDQGEPICFIFPVQRGTLERIHPRFAPLESAPELMAQFQAWSRSRNAFQAEMADRKPRPPTAMWQKRYYRGVDMDDRPGTADHRAKLRLRPFAHGAEPRPTPISVEADADALAEALAEIAAGLATDAGSTTLASRLAALGMPEQVVETVVRLARQKRDRSVPRA